MRVKATLVKIDQRFVYQFAVACSECKILMYTHPVYLDEFPPYNEELTDNVSRAFFSVMCPNLRCSILRTWFHNIRVKLQLKRI